MLKALCRQSHAVELSFHVLSIGIVTPLKVAVLSRLQGKPSLVVEEPPDVDEALPDAADAPSDVDEALPDAADAPSDVADAASDDACAAEELEDAVADALASVFDALLEEAWLVA